MERRHIRDYLVEHISKIVSGAMAKAAPDDASRQFAATFTKICIHGDLPSIHEMGQAVQWMWLRAPENHEKAWMAKTKECSHACTPECELLDEGVMVLRYQKVNHDGDAYHVCGKHCPLRGREFELHHQRNVIKKHVPVSVCAATGKVHVCGSSECKASAFQVDGNYICYVTGVVLDDVVIEDAWHPTSGGGGSRKRARDEDGGDAGDEIIEESDDEGEDIPDMEGERRETSKPSDNRRTVLELGNPEHNGRIIDGQTEIVLYRAVVEAAKAAQSAPLHQAPTRGRKPNRKPQPLRGGRRNVGRPRRMDKRDPKNPTACTVQSNGMVADEIRDLWHLEISRILNPASNREKNDARIASQIERCLAKEKSYRRRCRMTLPKKKRLVLDPVTGARVAVPVDPNEKFDITYYSSPDLMSVLLLMESTFEPVVNIEIPPGYEAVWQRVIEYYVLVVEDMYLTLMRIPSFQEASKSKDPDVSKVMRPENFAEAVLYLLRYGYPYLAKHASGIQRIDIVPQDFILKVAIGDPLTFTTDRNAKRSSRAVRDQFTETINSIKKFFALAIEKDHIPAEQLAVDLAGISDVLQCPVSTHAEFERLITTKRRELSARHSAELRGTVVTA